MTLSQHQDFENLESTEENETKVDLEKLKNEIMQDPTEKVEKPEEFEVVNFPREKFSEEALKTADAMNSEWERKNTHEHKIVSHNRLHYLSGGASLHYNHNHLKDLLEHDSAGFQAIKKFINEELVPRMGSEPLTAKEQIEQGRGQALAPLEIKVTGFASPKRATIDPETGLEITNEQLANNRAEAIKEYLVSVGLPAELIKTEGYVYKEVPPGMKDEDLPGVHIDMLAVEWRKIKTNYEDDELVSIET